MSELILRYIHKERWHCWAFLLFGLAGFKFVLSGLPRSMLCHAITKRYLLLGEKIIILWHLSGFHLQP
jgi:hypothetical protein